jgi:hypothetical protein
MPVARRVTGWPKRPPHTRQEPSGPVWLEKTARAPRVIRVMRVSSGRFSPSAPARTPSGHGASPAPPTIARPPACRPRARNRAKSGPAGARRPCKDEGRRAGRTRAGGRPAPLHARPPGCAGHRCGRPVVRRDPRFSAGRARGRVPRDEDGRSGRGRGCPARSTRCRMANASRASAACRASAG